MTETNGLAPVAAAAAPVAEAAPVGDPQQDLTVSNAAAVTDTAAAATNSQPAGAMTMFAPSGEGAANQTTTEALDLDDLFRDCYFGDFPVPPFAPVPTVVGSAPVATSQLPEPAPVQAAPAPGPALPTAPISEPPSVKIEISGTVPAPAVAQASASAVAPPPQAAPPQAVASTPVSAPAPVSAPDAVSAPAPVSSSVQLPKPTLATASAPVSEAPKRKAADAQLDADQSQPQTVTSLGPAAVQTGGESKPLTEQQKVERRERNREHAKRSRLRKKFLLESLQEQIHGLMSEIDTLKDIIKKELPDKAEKLLSTVGGEHEGKYTPLPMPSGFGPVKTLMEPDFRLMSALSGSQQNFAISDPSLPDNPIVYVSQGFLELTGYTLDQVLGRNCRFLQGPGTDQSAVDVIRRGVREGVDTSVCLLNYKADGTPFWNQFFVAALRDAENNVVNFVGVQCEVSKAVVEKHIAEGKTPSSALNL